MTTYPVNCLDAKDVVVHWDFSYSGDSYVHVKVTLAYWLGGPWGYENAGSTFGACNHIGYADRSTEEQTTKLLHTMFELVYFAPTRENKQAIVREFLKVREIWKACATDDQLMSIGSDGLIGKSLTCWPPYGYEHHAEDAA